jgi:site-specific DNA-methyltransferase (adenine-specific)
MQVNTKNIISTNWDNEIPKKEYFNELFRVSKEQIIWGGNYFF